MQILSVFQAATAKERRHTGRKKSSRPEMDLEQSRDRV